MKFEFFLKTHSMGWGFCWRLESKEGCAWNALLTLLTILWRLWSVHFIFLGFHLIKVWSDDSLGFILLRIPWVSEWVKSLSRVWLFATPWTVAHQAPPSMGFSRQEYWSGVPLLAVIIILTYLKAVISFLGFPGDSAQGICLQCGRPGFDP